MPFTIARALCALLIAPLAAQTTWTVTAQTGVQAAIDAASPGDIILLPNTGGSPDYTTFGVFKGVTIRGNGCRIGASPPAPQNMVFVSVPAGERAHFDGLDFSYSYNAQSGNTGTALQLTGGTLSLQRCIFAQRSLTAVQISDSNLVAENCSLEAIGGVWSGQGLHAVRSHVSLRDCTVRGSNTTIGTLGTSAQPAVYLANSTLHAERTSFVGGSNNVLFFSTAEGMIATGTSRLWLADCTVTGGNNTHGNGRTALLNSTSNPAELANTTLLAGTPNSVPSIGPVVMAPLVRLALAPALQRGATSTFSCQSTAAHLFGICVALDGAASFVPLVVEPVWITNNIVITSGLLDAAGSATHQVTVPNVPELQYVKLWFQAIGGLSLPLHASVLAGGMIL